MIPHDGAGDDGIFVICAGGEMLKNARPAWKVDRLSIEQRGSPESAVCRFRPFLSGMLQEGLTEMAAAVASTV
jgi:hypothetical protein